MPEKIMWKVLSLMFCWYCYFCWSVCLFSRDFFYLSSNDVVKYRLPWSCDGHLCRSTPTWFPQERSQKSHQTEREIQTTAADLGHRWCHWPASSRWRTGWMTQSAFASWGGQSVVGSPSGQNKTEPERETDRQTETETGRERVEKCFEVQPVMVNCCISHPRTALRYDQNGWFAVQSQLSLCGSPSPGQ